MTGERGFTIVEILVATAVAGIVGIMLVMIFANTLRGSNKSQILAVIKQNGQAVLENMDKTIRNSDNVVCVSSSNKTLLVVKNGTYTRYRIVLYTDTFGTAPDSCRGSGTNGCIVQDNPVRVGAETDTEFMIRACSSVDPMVSATVLTDTNTQTGVKIESGLFTRNTSAGFKDQMTIVFKLKPAVLIPPAIANQIDPVTFQTTVQLR